MAMYEPRRLVNSSLICYLNSTLQALSSCTNFIKGIEKLSNEYKNIEPLQNFNELLRSLTSNSRERLDAKRDNLFAKWTKTGEQDSFELFSYMMWQIYGKIKKNTNEDKWESLKLPMRIFIRYDLECLDGHRVICPKQSSIALHIPIPNIESIKEKLGESITVPSIQDLINYSLFESEIEDYECDKCKVANNKKSHQYSDGRKASKLTHIIAPLPKTICIRLRRTFWNGRSMVKINDNIKINETVLIKYKSEKRKEINEKEVNESKSIKEKKKEKNKKKKNNKKKKKMKNKKQKYQIKSVVVHSGSPYGGHYICYKWVNGKWYYTSDSFVECLQIESVPDCQAYFLFYEQM